MMDQKVVFKRWQAESGAARPVSIEDTDEAWLIGRAPFETLHEAWEWLLADARSSTEAITMEIPAPGGGTQTVRANSAAAAAWAGSQGKPSDPAPTVDREALIEVLAQLRADGLKAGYADEEEYWTTLTLFSDALGLWRPSETSQEAP